MRWLLPNMNFVHHLQHLKLWLSRWGTARRADLQDQLLGASPMEGLRAQCNIPNAYKIAMPFSNIFQEIQHTEQREELDITNHELKDGDEECRAGSWNVGVVDKSIRTLFVLQKIWRFPLWMSGARHSDTPPVSTNRDNSTTSNLRAKGGSDTKNCAHFTLLSNSPGASQSRPHGYEF